MTERNRTQLDTDIDAAMGTRDLAEHTLEKALFQALVDSYLSYTATAKTANYTVVINTDSGVNFSSSLDGMIFTLPSIAVGHVTTFINTADDGDAKLSVSPAAADGIEYVGGKVDDKDVINTKATANKGDFITIVSFSETVAWQVTGVRGIWAKE